MKTERIELERPQFEIDRSDARIELDRQRVELDRQRVEFDRPRVEIDHPESYIQTSSRRIEVTTTSTSSSSDEHGRSPGDSAREKFFSGGFYNPPCKYNLPVQPPFFKKKLVDTFPLMGPLIPRFWSSGDVSLVSKPQWAALFTLVGNVCDAHSPRSTFGVTLPTA